MQDWVCAPPQQTDSKAVGGGPVSPAMAGSLFDDLLVKGRHTFIWACAIGISITVQPIGEALWAFSNAYLAKASALRAGGGTPPSRTHP